MGEGRVQGGGRSEPGETTKRNISTVQLFCSCMFSCSDDGICLISPHNVVCLFFDSLFCVSLCVRLALIAEKGKQVEEFRRSEVSH